MANQMAIGAHAISVGIGYPLRATQRNQAAIVFFLFCTDKRSEYSVARQRKAADLENRSALTLPLAY